MWLTSLRYFSNLQNVADLEWDTYKSEPATKLEQNGSTAAHSDQPTAPQDLTLVEDNLTHADQIPTRDDQSDFPLRVTKKDLKKKKKKATVAVTDWSD